jgi:hypothetical protein
MEPMGDMVKTPDSLVDDLTFSAIRPPVKLLIVNSLSF